MAEDQTPEYTQEKMLLEAQRLAASIFGVYAGKERVGVVTVALHILIAHTGVNQGASLEDVMRGLADNVPLFFSKFEAEKPKDGSEPRPKPKLVIVER